MNPNDKLREALEYILPCISCGVNAAAEDGFGYCTCGNAERVDNILALFTHHLLEYRDRLVALLPEKKNMLNEPLNFTEEDDEEYPASNNDFKAMRAMGSVNGYNQALTEVKKIIEELK